MKQYKINQIFYSIQGEGYHTGMPAVFVRFAGCNLKCSYCDESTHHKYVKYTAKEILDDINLWNVDNVILTGGEPGLQIDEELLQMLRRYNVFIETNGTIDLNDLDYWIVWVTVSPKSLGYIQKRCHEIKIVYNGQSLEELQKYLDIYKHYKIKPDFYLQPENNKKEYINDILKICQKQKQWRLSCQVQKLINIK